MQIYIVISLISLFQVHKSKMRSSNKSLSSAHRKRSSCNSRRKVKRQISAPPFDGINSHCNVHYADLDIHAEADDDETDSTVEGDHTCTSPNYRSLDKERDSDSGSVSMLNASVNSSTDESPGSGGALTDEIMPSPQKVVIPNNYTDITQSCLPGQQRSSTPTSHLERDRKHSDPLDIQCYDQCCQKSTDKPENTVNDSNLVVSLNRPPDDILLRSPTPIKEVLLDHPEVELLRNLVKPHSPRPVLRNPSFSPSSKVQTLPAALKRRDSKPQIKQKPTWARSKSLRDSTGASFGDDQCDNNFGDKSNSLSREFPLLRGVRDCGVKNNSNTVIQMEDDVDQNDEHISPLLSDKTDGCHGNNDDDQIVMYSDDKVECVHMLKGGAEMVY